MSLHLQLRVTLLLRLAIAWIAFLSLWLLFVFQVSTPELIVGAVASALTVLGGYVTFRVAPACFKPRLRWLAQAWQLPAMVVKDLWPLARHLGREITHQPSRSAFQKVAFQAVGDDCCATAQRALAVLYVSTTPNTVVLDIDRQKAEMLFHVMEPEPLPGLVRTLQEPS